MIPIHKLVECIQKVNPSIQLRVTQDNYHDRLPAALYQGNNFVMAVPKGFVYEHTRWNDDGSISHRGYREIIRQLGLRRLVNEHKLSGLINKL